LRGGLASMRLPGHGNDTMAKPIPDTQMKAHITSITVLAFALAQMATAQTKQPGNPEDNGLLPKTDTFYINVPPDNLNNGKVESLGVAIANNGNVIVGWEDDGDGVTDFEAVWMLFDPAGKTLSSDGEVHKADGTKVTTRYRAFFRKDGTAVSGHTSWGPKIKANLFGDGIGMGATAFELGLDVPEFASIQTTPAGDAGDFPAVQLLTNDGKPLGIVSGVDDTYADADGNIRIGDWEYLSNGNIVIVGESRQKQDLIDKYKGASGENHAIYRIVDATGKEIRPVGLVSSEPVKSEIWHGVGVTKNGFAVRFSWNGVGAVRLFDNSGAPISTNLNIATITGKAGAANGNRGDGTGFHGNGVDAYVVVNSGTDEQGAKQVWLTVLNSTNGSVRWSRAVADDITLNGPDRVDAAIDASGRVIAVFDDTSATGGANRLVLGRMFDERGNPLGGTFYVSERENGPGATLESRQARVAWRGGLAVVVWQSLNEPTSPDKRVVGARLFSTFTAGSVESVGLKRIVADTPVINPQADALGNWEPNISVLGNSVFLIEGNTFADGSATEQRYVVAFQPAGGKPMKLGEGFFGDDGKPYKGQINASRQNGNPGRVAGDKRPGAVNFIVGGEASPHAFPAFGSDKRWTLGFDRGADGRYATIQTYKLDVSTLTQTPLSKAIDAVNGRLTSGAPAVSPEIGRFGGDVAGLDNGNFVVVADDRSNARATDRAATAVIVAPDGSIVKESFTIDIGQIWSNVAAHKGGFAVRINSNIRFYDNEGNLKGTVAQNTSGEAFDAGRGDGTRIASHINSPYVFLTGKVTSGNLVKAAAFDSRDQKFVAVTEVSEPAFAGDFDRVNMAVDALNRLTVSWVSKPPGYEQQQVAARVLAFDGAKKAFTPLTKSFLAFLNASKTGGIRTLQMSVATTTKEICIAAKGEINLQNKPELGVTSPREVNLFTVISHPDPKDDPTPPLGGAPAQALITKVVETGGDNEPIDTIVAQWTGQTFTVSVVNEPIPGAVIGDKYTVGLFRNHAPAFVDRNHRYTNASDTVSIPAYLVGGEYIMSGNDNRDNADYLLDVTVSAAVQAYLLIDNRLGDPNSANSDPPSFGPTKMKWVLDQGWTPMISGKNRAGSATAPDEVGFDEGADGSINQWYSVYTKAFPSGTFQLKQADNAGQNMYGVVITRATGGVTPPVGGRPTFGKSTLSGTTLTVAWTGGGKLQEASDVTGPWTDVTGNPQGTFSAQTTGARKFYRVLAP